MALDVKYNEASFTAELSDPSKMKNTIKIVKRPRHPSLFYCKFSEGASPDAFDQSFTDLEKAIKFATKYIEDMKITQGAKNEQLAQRRADRKEELEKV